MKSKRKRGYFVIVIMLGVVLDIAALMLLTVYILMWRVFLGVFVIWVFCWIVL